MRLDHCVIAVTDWERSNAFYCDVLGAELVELDKGRYAYRFGEQQLNVHGPGSTPDPRAADPVHPGNVIGLDFTDVSYYFVFFGIELLLIGATTWTCVRSWNLPSA